MSSAAPAGHGSNPDLLAAERKRVSLRVEIDALQATLVRLLQDVVDAETRLDNTQAAKLVEANEQLVVAALASQDQADTAAAALADTTRLATLDALTNLPNRHTLLDRFAQAVAQARRHKTRLALLFVDLDQFKLLNDRHGHAFGDRVLRLVAERLVGAVREGDTVSRHGGDEFLVLLAEIQFPADAQAVADKLNAALKQPALVDGQDVQIAASVGVAIYPEHGEDLETLTAYADDAMYAQKRARAPEAAAPRSQAQPDGKPGTDGAGGSSAAVVATPPATQPVDPATQLAELREANEQLVLSALGAQELQAAAERARERQEVFLTAVAEELGNPLAPIRIANAMLGRLTGVEPLLPRVRQAIDQQMAQMSALVGRLVEASTGAGDLDVVHEWVDMVAVARAAVDTYRPILLRHRLGLDWQPPSEPIGVMGDFERLQQIVSNLLDHACTHTPDGGHISVTLKAGAEVLTLTVSDNGLGIPPHALPDVFDPFVLDLHALDFNGVGLGVGLTVARALVQAHGGSISAHSDGVRRGERFEVTLPLAPSQAPPTPLAPERPRNRADGSD